MKKEMKKKTGLGIAMVSAILMLGSIAEAFSGAGSGTEQDPYIITDVYQLQEMNNDLTAWYELGNDIDASDTINWNDGAGFDPVGPQYTPFTGYFDGKEHKIRSLFINRPDTNYIGLFGTADEGSEIKNIGLVNVDITGKSKTGSLVGQILGSHIVNCYSVGSVDGTSSTGGLVGSFYTSFMNNCFSGGEINGARNGRGNGAGGLVGSVGSLNPELYPPPTINDSYSTSNVNGHIMVGGLVGINGSGMITNSYSTGNVIGAWDVGGFCGINSPGHITNCYSAGSVSGSGDNIFGFLGRVSQEWACYDCFWDIETSGQEDSAGEGDGVTGKTTAEMKQEATFTNWDFANIWDIDEGVTYPFHSRIFPGKAAELAKEIIGKDYGYKWYKWPEKIKGFTKYYVGDERIVELLKAEQIESLDCSGLSFRSYNRAYYAGKKIFAGERWEEEEGDWENRPLKWYGASMQYRGNTKSINKEALIPGDLLFFDTDDNATMDHVAMYVGGPFEFTYGTDKAFTYNTVESTAWGDEIITVAFYDEGNEIITTLQPSTDETRTLPVAEYGRVKDAEKPRFKVISGSPVDLIVTDPEGETITKEMGESLTMEYVTYDIDGDGELDDIVASPERKIGNYLIEVVPEPNASPTDTYSLEATIDDQTMILAEDVQIQGIPEDPYEVESKLCYSDFDDSNDVDLIDYAIFASHWFEQDCNYPAWCEGTDLDYGGSVGFNDLAIFAEHWLWSESQPMGGQGGGMGGSSSQQMRQPLDMQPVQQVQPIEVQPVKKIDIDEIVRFFEEIWLQDDGIREVISEDRWNEFIDKVKNPPAY